MATEWRTGGPGMRRAQFADEGGRVFVVSSGTAALSLEVSKGGTASLDLHVPFPVSDVTIAGGYDPTPCEYVEGPGCYGTSWYGLAREMWKEHGDTPALWTALEAMLADRFSYFEREWAHKRRCAHCSGTGVIA